MITLPRHKHPPHCRLAESNSPLSLFLPCISLLTLTCSPVWSFFSVSIPHFFSPYHQLIPLLCPLFSNPLFLSFISSVENGISTNIHSASLSFLFCFCQPPPPSLSLPLSFSPTPGPPVLLLFLLLTFLPSSFLTPPLSLRTPLSHFLTAFVTACFFFSRGSFNGRVHVSVWAMTYFFPSYRSLRVSRSPFFYSPSVLYLSLFHSPFPPVVPHLTDWTSISD